MAVGVTVSSAFVLPLALARTHAYPQLVMSSSSACVSLCQLLGVAVLERGTPVTPLDACSPATEAHSSPVAAATAPRVFTVAVHEYVRSAGLCTRGVHRVRGLTGSSDVRVLRVLLAKEKNADVEALTLLARAGRKMRDGRSLAHYGVKFSAPAVTLLMD